MVVYSVGLLEVDSIGFFDQLVIIAISWTLSWIVGRWAGFAIAIVVAIRRRGEIDVKRTRYVLWRELIEYVV